MPGGPVYPGPLTADHSMNAADVAIRFARSQIGKPYRYGFTGPNYYDCSGLVQTAYGQAGIKLPRTSEMMLNVGTPVREADLQPGDLVFPDSGHVQIYVGDRMVVEAPRTGLNVREVKMWGFFAARRVTQPGTSIVDIVTDPLKSVVSGGSDVIRKAFEALPGVKQLETFGTVLEKLSDPALWQRIGIGALGVTFVVIGFTLLARKPIQQAATVAAKAAV